jgi:hypothetical protein
MFMLNYMMKMDPFFSHMLKVVYVSRGDFMNG